MKLIMENWRNYINEYDASSAALEKLMKFVEKVKNISKDKNVQLGAKIIKDLAKDRKVSANDVFKLAFKKDPLGKIRVNIGAMSRLGQDPASHLTAAGLQTPKELPAFHGATASISFE